MSEQRISEITKTYTNDKITFINFIFDKKEYFSTFQDVTLNTKFFTCSCRIGKQYYTYNNDHGLKSPYIASIFLSVRPEIQHLKYKEIIVEFIKLKEIIENTVSAINTSEYNVSFHDMGWFFETILQRELDQ